MSFSDGDARSSSEDDDDDDDDDDHDDHDDHDDEDDCDGTGEGAVSVRFINVLRLVGDRAGDGGVCIDGVGTSDSGVASAEICSDSLGWCRAWRVEGVENDDGVGCAASGMLPSNLRAFLMKSRVPVCYLTAAGS